MDQIGQRFVLIGSLFLFYLGVIICFAFLYFRKFKRNPSLFVFASDISKGQAAGKASEMRMRLDDLAHAEDILSEAASQVRTAGTNRIFPNDWHLRTEHGDIDFWGDEHEMGGTIQISTATMLVFTRANGRIRRMVWDWRTGFHEYSEYDKAIFLKEISEQLDMIKSEGNKRSRRSLN